MCHAVVMPGSTRARAIESDSSAGELKVSMIWQRSGVENSLEASCFQRAVGMVALSQGTRLRDQCGKSDRVTGVSLRVMRRVTIAVAVCALLEWRTRSWQAGCGKKSRSFAAFASRLTSLRMTNTLTADAKLADGICRDKQVLRCVRLAAHSAQDHKNLTRGLLFL